MKAMDRVGVLVFIALPLFACPLAFRAWEKSLAGEWGQGNEEGSKSRLWLQLGCEALGGALADEGLADWVAWRSQ